MDEAEIQKIYEFFELEEDERKLLEIYAKATGEKIGEVSLDEAEMKFAGTANSYEEFARKLIENGGYLPKNFPEWIVIDYKETWESALRFDYITAEDENGTIYFFHNS